MTWISLPSFSVTSALTGILAQLGSASSASSKSDGRTPRITSWSKNRSRPGLASMTAAEPEAGARRRPRAGVAEYLGVTKFIAGEPMKPATNRFTGASKSRCGLSTCCSLPSRRT
jgi:hypothetical protein